MLRIQCGITILILAVFVTVFYSDKGWSISREESLSYLLELQRHNRNFLQRVDGRIRSELDGAQQIRLSLSDSDQFTEPRRTAQELSVLERNLEELHQERREYLLRQDFIDRLVLQVDTHFQGGNLRDFLQQRLIEMAKREAMSLQGQSHFWQFLTYASLAVQQLPEKTENPLAFLEGYMRFSSLSSPKRPDEFLSERNYTNGVVSVMAQPVARDRVGDIVEERLQSLSDLSKN